MRKILLFVIIGLTFNAMAQKSHKATGDKPLYSKSFEMYGNNDSICDNATVYEYDANQRIVGSVIYYSDYRESTTYEYDQKDRLTSTNVYFEGDLYLSTIWVYDENASRIDNYILEEGMGVSMDTVSHIIYYGVKDMEDLGESIDIMGMEIRMIDCDSMHSYMDMYDGAGLVEAVKFYPVYQNGHPATAVLKLSSAMVAVFIPDMPLDLVINLVFTYSGEKLMTVKGSTSIVVMGFPVPLTDFFTITNLYTGDLLTEIKSVIDVELFDENMYMGTKINYLYNSEDNKICEAMSYTEEKGAWDVESKIWYYYENPVEDVALIYIEPSDNGKDNAGEDITIYVDLENSGLTDYEQVAITAIISSLSGEEAISEVIPMLNPLVTTTYEFSATYTVPNDSIYTITVYIQNIDDNAENDTLSVTRLVNTNVNIPSIAANRLSLGQNFPNPAMEKTTINYSVPHDGEINFTIYSISGQLLYNKKETVSFGEYQMELNLSDYASGIYFYTMEYNGQRITKRMSVKR